MVTNVLGEDPAITAEKCARLKKSFTQPQVTAYPPAVLTLWHDESLHKGDGGAGHVTFAASTS
jgi:hypothetical protein